MGEKTYENIYEGSWITNDEYGVIHRIAVDGGLKGRGVSSKIIKEAEKICLDEGIHCLKVDTHEDNKSMQKFLEKNGFIYCGVIYLADGAKRVAFEKNF
ncbi:MAG: GNAT family N-acetyltransferase [Clostridium sp.]|nr:GNAT family N-acetyltransferase [Clostridium sp.]